MPRKFLVAAFVSALLAGLAPAHARDTSVKVILDGQYWFCHTDPTGWTLADFKAVCSMIEGGGKGDFVAFMVDHRGKVRRKPAEPKKAPATGDPTLRGSTT